MRRRALLACLLPTRLNKATEGLTVYGLYVERTAIAFLRSAVSIVRHWPGPLFRPVSSPERHQRGGRGGEWSSGPDRRWEDHDRMIY